MVRVLFDTAVIVALVTLVGTIIEILLPYYLRERKRRRKKGASA